MSAIPVLDGAPQFILLGLIVAVLAYLRQGPVKELRGNLEKERIAPKKERLVRAWIFLLSVLQFGLVVLALLVAGRIAGIPLPVSDLDASILTLGWWLTVTFVILHVLFDIRAMVLSVFGKKLEP